MGGMLVNLRARSTRKGRMMGFLILEDLTGQIEGLIFPAVYDREYKDLKEDAAVLVEGKLSVREDEDIKLIVDRVLPLEELRGIPKGPPRPPEVLAKEAPVKVYLRLKREQMPACEQVLRRMQGDIPVYINLPDEDITLLAPRDWWCDDADDARANLLEYVLRDDIKVVKKQ